MKNSIVFYSSWGKLFKGLPKEAAGELIQKICEYSFEDNSEPTENEFVQAMFQMIKAKLDEDAESYDRAIQKRSAAGKKGMEKRWKDNNVITNDNNVITPITNDNSVRQSITNITDTVSVSVSDTVSDTVSVSEYVSESDKDKRVYTRPKEPKESFGENGNVKLTVKEREKLIAEYGSDLTERAIEFLDGYIADKGYKSKSNYQAIRRWVIDAVRERKPTAEKFDADDYLLKIIRGEEDGA